MRQQSEDEEGFIASGLEINNRDKNDKIAAPTPTPSHSSLTVRYRYCGYFIKNENPLSLSTPLTLTHQSSTHPPAINRMQPKTQILHPYQQYCCSPQFSLVYSKFCDEPLVFQSEFIKHQVSLMGIDDPRWPSLKELKPFQYEQPQKLQCQDDLLFDSKFQNGNLHCAFRKRGRQEYHLFMQNDTNTLGYNQWFYFSLRNTRKNTKYLFHIVNYRKRLRFFEEGQRIVLFSLHDAEQHKNGWRRAGHNYLVQQSSLQSSLQKKFYTLSFSVQFPHDHDYVCLASSIPYSYSKLLRELKQIEAEALRNPNLRWSVGSVGTTICGNQVPEVTITSKNSEKKEKEKKMIVVMARQHPGEVWSSYMVEGLMRALLKETPEAKYILQNCVVKVIPMINIDGVIYGNFRCDVTGVDLNRRWKDPSRVFHPHIHSIKRKLQSYSRNWKIELCMDFHGHSKKYNIFCYSCKHNSYTCRIFPYLIEKQSPLFNLPNCTFGLTSDKLSTARATISSIIKSENVLTLQTSSFGWLNSSKPKPFNPIDLHKFTQSICIALSHFLDKQSPTYAQAEISIRKHYQDLKQLDHQNEEDSGSESAPEEDQIDFQMKLATIFDQKYQLEFANPQNHTKTHQVDTQEADLLAQKLVHNIKNTSIEKQMKQLIVSFPANSQQAEESKRITKIAQKTTIRTSKRQSQYNSIHRTIASTFANQKLREKPKNTRIVSKSFISRDKNQLAAKQKTLTQTFTLRSQAFTQTREEAARPKTIQHRQRSYHFNDAKQPVIDKIDHFARVYNRSHQDVGQSRKQAKEAYNLPTAFKQAALTEEKKIAAGFIDKFQPFTPLAASYKKNNRLDMLQEGLQKDDSSFQLNLMFENKRKLELQRIKKYFQDFRQPGEFRLSKSLKRKSFLDFRNAHQHEKVSYLYNQKISSS